MTLPLTISADTTSHQWGYHHYVDLAGGCLRRACTEHDDSSEDSNFGTAMHKWLSHYHWQTPAELPILATTPPAKGGCSEIDLASRYMAANSITCFGTALRAADGSPLIERRLHGALAGEPFAGTFDAIVSINEAQARCIAAERGVTLDPGVYLVDHKTKKQHSAGLTEMYLTDPQFAGYHHLWEQAQSAVGAAWQPLRGTLVNILFRYKGEPPTGKRAFITLFVEPPDDAVKATLRSIVELGAERLRTYGPAHCTPTPSQCFAFGRSCPLIMGCPRANPPNSEGIEKCFR